MAERYSLGPIHHIPPGEGRNFKLGDRKVAVFRTRDGGVFATQASCPHRAGPLADGLLGGHSLVCPAARLAVRSENRLVPERQLQHQDLQRQRRARRHRHGGSGRRRGNHGDARCRSNDRRHRHRHFAASVSIGVGLQEARPTSVNRRSGLLEPDTPSQPLNASGRACSPASRSQPATG